MTKIRSNIFRYRRSFGRRFRLLITHMRQPEGDEKEEPREEIVSVKYFRTAPKASAAQDEYRIKDTRSYVQVKCDVHGWQPTINDPRDGICSECWFTDRDNVAIVIGEYQAYGDDGQLAVRPAAFVRLPDIDSGHDTVMLEHLPIEGTSDKEAFADKWEKYARAHGFDFVNNP